MRTVAAPLCSAPCPTRGRRLVIALSVALLLFAVTPLVTAQDMSVGAPPQGAAPRGQAPAVGQGQAAQDNRASENVAAAQIEQFYKIVESKEIDGEPLSLERTLNGVYNPNERLRRLLAYWDLAAKYATYNLSLKYYNFAQECVSKIANENNAASLPQETIQLANSARQLATQRRQAARLAFIQAQYDFDAAFTTPAGRRAAINRASYYSAQGGKMIGVDSAVLYIPAAYPSTEPYNTRYDQAAQVRRMSTEATRLYALLPLLYDSLQTRASQTQNDFSVLINAYQAQTTTPVALFAALDNYYDAAREMITAATRYNQAIASYVAQTVPGSVQGVTLLATLNQRAGSEQTYRPSGASDTSRAPAQGEATPNPAGVRPPQAYYSPYDYDPRFAVVLPGLFGSGASGSAFGYAAVAVPEPARVTPLSSLAANLATLPPAFPDAGALNANASEALVAAATSPQNEDARATFENVSYQTPQPQSPPEPAPTPEPAPKPTPEPTAQTPAPEQPATPPADDAPAEKPADDKPAEEPAPAQEQPAQPDENEPGDSSSDTMAKNPGNARFPLILFVTGYERDLKLPWRPDQNSQLNSREPLRPEPARKPNGAYINREVEDEELAFFLQLTRDALAQVEDDCAASSVDAIVRGQDDQGLSLLDDDPIGYAPNPQAPQAVPAGAPMGGPGAPPQFGAPGANPQGMPPAGANAIGGAPNGQFGQTAQNTQNAASSNPANTTRSGDSAKVKLVARTLFAQSVADLSDQDKGVYERPISLYDALYNVPANAEARYNATIAYWKLQGATARLRVEQTLLTNYRRLYNYAREHSPGGADDSQNRVARQCLSAAFRAEARVNEATVLKRSTQIDLLQRIGGRVDTSNYPLPSTLPFCGDVFYDGDPGAYNPHMRRALGVIPQRIKALQELGATFGSPETLLSLDANPGGQIDPEVALAVLEKKRQVALLFIDAELALNFAIAEYVAYFPANVSNERYVEALIGRGN